MFRPTSVTISSHLLSKLINQLHRRGVANYVLLWFEALLQAHFTVGLRLASQII